MREILFRGKTAQGEWVYGLPVPVEINTYPTSEIFMVKKCALDELDIAGFEFEEVIPETVGQYTGLVDKNGTKIFEGDILIYFDNEIQVVEFWEDVKQIMLHTYSEIERKVGRKTVVEKVDGWNWLDDYPLDEMTIVGNIHDNNAGDRK